MRNRNNRVQVWLCDKEYEKLLRDIARSGLKREPYLRVLISGCTPRETPPLEYRELIKELHAIGTNLNQIAVRANATGFVEAPAYDVQAAKLRAAILSIQKQMVVPEKRG